MKNTQKMVFTALLCALTCVATMVIKIPTPTMGYIHPGDAVVLLCGFLLGPLSGALAAGIGSGFSDLFSGYLTYAPATLLIKTGTAFLAGMVAKKLKKAGTKNHGVVPVIIGGMVGEIFMVAGYFVFEIFLMAAAAAGGLTAATLAAAAASALSGIPFNVIQGLFGIVAAAILYPFLRNLSLKGAEN